MKKYYKKNSIIKYYNIIIIIFFRNILINMLFLYYISDNVSFIKKFIFNKYYSKFICSKCYMNNYKFLFNEKIDIFQCEYCMTYNITQGKTCQNYLSNFNLKKIYSNKGISKYRLDIYSY